MILLIFCACRSHSSQKSVFGCYFPSVFYTSAALCLPYALLHFSPWNRYSPCMESFKLAQVNSFVMCTRFSLCCFLSLCFPFLLSLPLSIYFSLFSLFLTPSLPALRIWVEAMYSPMGASAGSFLTPNEHAQSAKPQPQPQKGEMFNVPLLYASGNHHLATANDLCSANGSSVKPDGQLRFSTTIIAPILQHIGKVSISTLVTNVC